MLFYFFDFSCSEIFIRNFQVKYRENCSRKFVRFCIQLIDAIIPINSTVFVYRDRCVSKRNKLSKKHFVNRFFKTIRYANQLALCTLIIYITFSSEGFELFGLILIQIITLLCFKVFRNEKHHHTPPPPLPLDLACSLDLSRRKQKRLILSSDRIVLTLLQKNQILKVIYAQILDETVDKSLSNANTSATFVVT